MIYDEKILTNVIRNTFLAKRHKLGLTQLGLSLESSITRQFISQVESGKRSPSIYTMSALAAASNQTLAELFKEIDALYLHEASLEAENSSSAKAASQNFGKSYIQNIEQTKSTSQV